MNFLDPTTLAAVCTFVAVLCGACLVVVGWRYQATRTAGLWGLSGLVAAVGLGLFMDSHSIDLAFGGVIFASLLAWISMAQFNGRRVNPVGLAAGPVMWAMIALGPIDPVGRMAIAQLILAGYFLATAFELWRGRAERLSSRWPMTVLVVFQGTTFLVGAAFVTFAGGIDATTISLATFTPAFIGTIAFSIGTSIFVVSMIKERRINQERIAAGTDSLTGVFNRGAFFAEAPAVMAGALARGVPVAAVLFDLDRFKQINDTFGHRVGDTVIQRFASTLARFRRSEDVVGRIGGEEFALLLPGTDCQAAMALAERIRAAFAEDGRWVDGRALKATVSAGMAVSGQTNNIGDLLDAADKALYLAKAKGRDRVLASGDDSNNSTGVVIRFA